MSATESSHVLVVFNGSTKTFASLDHPLASDETTEITVVYVIEPFEAEHSGPVPPLLGYWGNWYVDERERAETMVAAARTRADAVGVTANTLIERGRTSAVTFQAAATYGVDQVVVDGNDRNLLSRVVGTTAQRIVRQAPVPVTVV